MTKKQFIENEFRNLDLDMRNWYVQKLFENVLSASDILSKKELKQLIEDSVDLMGLSLY